MMKKYLFASLRLTLILLVLCSVVYPLLIAGIAKIAPGKGDGQTVIIQGKTVGYSNIGQKFNQDKYFWGRPSAADYNAASSSGSNKGATNPEYLKQVQDRIDSFLVHNPGVQKKQIPADLVTASGSGLDPDISPAGAYVQVKRIATIRGLKETSVKELVASHIDNGILGPDKVNVLALNIALDKIK